MGKSAELNRQVANEGKKDNIEQLMNDTVEVLQRNSIEPCANLSEDLKSRLLKSLTNCRLDEYDTTVWGGEVWDQLFHYYDEEYKRILVLNYDEIKNSSRCISPVEASFPYKDLNRICRIFVEKTCQ